MRGISFLDQSWTFFSLAWPCVGALQHCAAQLHGYMPAILVLLHAVSVMDTLINVCAVECV